LARPTFVVDRRAGIGGAPSAPRDGPPAGADVERKTDAADACDHAESLCEAERGTTTTTTTPPAATP